MAKPKIFIMVEVPQNRIAHLNDFCIEFLGATLDEMVKLKAAMFMSKCEDQIRSIDTYIAQLQRGN